MQESSDTSSTPGCLPSFLSPVSLLRPPKASRQLCFCPAPSLLHCQHKHTCACGGERNVHGAKGGSGDLGLIIRLAQLTELQMSRRVCLSEKQEEGLQEPPRHRVKRGEGEGEDRGRLTLRAVTACVCPRESCSWKPVSSSRGLWPVALIQELSSGPTFCGR